MKTVHVVLFAALATLCAARELKQATTGRVTFFDNTNYSGGGQAFEARVPASGCGDCNDLVRCTPQKMECAHWSSAAFHIGPYCMIV
jgi:hypothetical protein